MPRIVLTSRAENDLQTIHEHYGSKMGDRAADGIVVRLIRSLRPLQELTGMGRPSQVPGIRELVFTDLPFIAPYRVVSGEVQILRILHQRAERPSQW